MSFVCLLLSEIVAGNVASLMQVLAEVSVAVKLRGYCESVRGVSGKSGMFCRLVLKWMVNALDIDTVTVDALMLSLSAWCYFTVFGAMLLNVLQSPSGNVAVLII